MNEWFCLFRRASKAIPIPTPRCYADRVLRRSSRVISCLIVGTSRFGTTMTA